MAVRHDDLRYVIGPRTADHGELKWLVMVLEEVSDVGSVRDQAFTGSLGGPAEVQASTADGQ
ncbi:MAG TPA: hypothetical protein VJ777_14510 [Mycobacterium sp.]|nr:hypothetical protein [Mycobacterium sp.]